MEDLNDDINFEIVKKLDYKSLNSLCATNLLFRRFCMEFQSAIYKYLLQRDYEVNVRTIPDDQAKAIYIEILSSLERTLALLRQNGCSKFADYLELDCIRQPRGVKTFFSNHTDFIILAPSDQALERFKTDVQSLSDEQLFDHMGNALIGNNFGFYRNGRFKNFQGVLYDAIPGNSVNGKRIIPLGIVNNFVNVNIISREGYGVFIDDAVTRNWIQYFEDPENLYGFMEYGRPANLGN